MGKQYSVRLSASVIIERSGYLLFVKERRGIRHIYNEPVGRVEAGELVATAAAREVYEETGYRVKIGRLFGVYQVIRRRSRSNDSIRFVFLGKVKGGSPAGRKEKGIIPLWVRKSEIRKYWKKIKRPVSRAVLRDYLARRTKGTIISSVRGLR